MINIQLKKKSDGVEETYRADLEYGKDHTINPSLNGDDDDDDDDNDKRSTSTHSRRYRRGHRRRYRPLIPLETKQDGVRFAGSQVN